MSVALQENTRFNQVFNEIMKSYHQAESNHSKMARIMGAELFKNPDDLEQNTRIFCEELAISNIMAYKRQYAENHDEAKELNVNPPKIGDGQGFENKCAFLKALHCIHYNLYDNGGNITQFKQTNERLEKLIDHLQQWIIDELPEYQKAEWF